MKVVVSTQQGIALRNVRIARTHWQKLRGLMGVRQLHPDDGLLIENCRSIHCCFMKMAIDVVFLDATGRIVHLIHAMQPWRVSPYVKTARDVLECKAGTAIAKGWRVGDVLVVKSA